MQEKICGIDEVGRGPLAGAVMSACVFIPESQKEKPIWQYVTDSKKLTRKKRELLFNDICNSCIYGIGQCSPAEIDRLNIHNATLLAMKRAFENMLQKQGGSLKITLALVDGKFSPELPCPARAVIGGDGKSLHIAAASIIAKVTRDREMEKLHEKHPVYGWNKNAGYGTKQHIEAIKTHGITKHHRKSFSPCKNV